MGKQRQDVKKSIVERLVESPANIKMLSQAAKCTRQTARVHLAELEMNGQVKSLNLGYLRLYWLP